MARTYLRGKSISFLVDGVEYNLDVSSVTLTSTPSEEDFVSIAVANAGGSWDWTLNITAVQSLDADSLHSFMWDNQGTEVDFILAPAGNPVPSGAEPHWTGTVLIEQKPDVGGEATAVLTFEQSLRVVGQPTKITAPPGP